MHTIFEVGINDTGLFMDVVIYSNNFSNSAYVFLELLTDNLNEATNEMVRIKNICLFPFARLVHDL
jgi:hypothetical protein